MARNHRSLVARWRRSAASHPTLIQDYAAMRAKREVLKSVDDVVDLFRRYDVLRAEVRALIETLGLNGADPDLITDLVFLARYNELMEGLQP